eukprot:Nitzschia sp. Nitz4//scaffold9_size221794//98048//100393//NITZ4_001348-RA/size221794-snap-gene-0.100-mRNA-1//1//CDS//3329561007//5436//frame0
MPFARVGAMPQPNNTSKQRNSSRSGRNSSSRQKGITMEDLKKQTALRLAQEQRQKQQATTPFVEPAAPRTAHAFSPLDPASASHRQPPPSQLHHNTQYSHSNSNHSYAANSYYDTPHSVQGHRQEQSNSYIAGKPFEANATLNRFSPPNHSNHTFTETRSVETSQQSAPPVNHSFPQDARVLGSAPVAPFVAQSSSDRDPSAAPQGSNKSKLPHGLTVHELKEMTKARLQAEASDRSDTMEPLDARRFSPLDFESLPDTRERTASRDSGVNNSAGAGAPFLQHSSDSMSSIPSLVHVGQVGQQYREHQVSNRPARISPVPPGLQGSTHNSMPSLTAVPNQQQSRVDAWDNASAASGSDSVYSSGMGSSFLQPADSDVPLNRARAHSSSHVQVSQTSFSPARASPGGSSFFDTAVGSGNRLRASTMSPRTDSIHEDRPTFHGDELRMPNFSSNARSVLHSRPSIRSYSPVMEFGSGDTILGQQPGLAPLRGADWNRPRTASATSLPPASHDFDRFNRDRANTFNGFSTSHGNVDPFSRDIPSALTENFLSGTAADTRPSPLVAPPGFGRSSDQEIRGFSSTRPLGSSLLRGDGVDNLAMGFGSFLQLSGGVDDAPSRSNHSNRNGFDSFQN